MNALVAHMAQLKLMIQEPKPQLKDKYPPAEHTLQSTD